MSDIEIERKYLLTRLPDDARRAEPVTSHHGYFPTAGTIRERVSERTLESGQVSYRRTVKVMMDQLSDRHPLRRWEFKEVIDKKTFDLFWPLTEGRRIKKVRRTVLAGGRTWEFDEFLSVPGLFVLEVEFKDIPDTASYRVPKWISDCVDREISHDPAYDAYALAR